MLTWIRRWAYAAALLGASVVVAWWFARQTASFATLDSLVRRHPVVAGQVGEVASVSLPLFGYGVVVTDGRLDPHFRVHVVGAGGEAVVQADFVDGRIADASLMTSTGHTIPLVVPR